jgi:hypothetical protein
MRLLRVRLSAAKALIEGSPTASNAQAKAFIEALRQKPKLDIKMQEVLIKDLTSCKFAVEDLQLVLEAVSQHAKVSRRLATIVHPQIMQMFTQSEWEAMLKERASAFEILEVILKRCFSWAQSISMSIRVSF